MSRLRCGDLNIAESVSIAKSFRARAIGLLNRKDMAEQETLWILQCNSIHTFGMRFSLDCVFVDKHLQIVDILRNVKPHRLTWPRFRASSVFEFKAGNSAVAKLKLGDQLHVGD
jgi:uncharacterized membrane protein (UPF0127 family)